MRSRFAVALTALLLPALAGPPAAAAASDVEGPNILVRVEPSTKDRFVALRDSGWDVIHIHGNTFDILVDDAQLAELLASGDRVTIEDDDVYANLREIKARRGTLIGNYTTYAEMAARMQDRASTYPSICSVQSIGTSHEGRDIWAMKISDNVGTDEGEPGVLYMGTYHARELIAVEIPLALADSLLMNYGSDARYTDWVNEREIWFIPIVNVDGHVYVENNDTNWRKNRRNNGGGSFGVDINRNHDWQWGHDNNGSSGTPSSLTYRGPSPASEPEVQAIQNFVNAHSNLRFSISYHSYGDLWLWGPGYKPGLSPDQDLFGEYGAQATAANGYLPGNPAVGAIYITNGDVNDWLYNSPSHPRIYGMTPEVGSAFYPPESQIPSLVAENIEPAWIALDNADRPERLAPPGQPTLSAIPDSPNGDALVQWSAPTTADTLPVEYELVMKEGATVTTDGFESAGSAIFTNGWTRSTARKFAGS
ncbi:MAG: zinc carboxypeptidase, partial [Gemmatimonadetes bacterium]|nr:zinc carboxypeptidase [Gemmatimonadota bacterium]